MWSRGSATDAANNADKISVDGRSRVLHKGKGSQCSIAKRRVPELIPVLGSQPAGDVSHEPSGRLSSLSARPAVAGVDGFAARGHGPSTRVYYFSSCHIQKRVWSFRPLWHVFSLN